MKPLVLVDGAAGFLGGHLVRAFLEAGYPVRATDLLGHSLDPLRAQGAQTVPSDLGRPETLEAALEGVEIAVHAAALFDLAAPQEKLYKINVEGTENLCRAALKRGVKRFIHISSCDIYGPLKIVPAPEDHQPRPLNTYAVSKLESEVVVQKFGREAGLAATIVRPSMIYGPGSRYIACILFAIPAILVGRGIRRIPFIRGGIRFTPVHVEDVAGACVHLASAEAAVGQTYNLAQVQPTTIGAFFQEIYRSMGIKISWALPLSKTLTGLIGRLGLSLPDPMFAGRINSYIKKKWAIIQQLYDLDRSFSLRFNKEIFSYFIGERAFSVERVLATGFKFKFPHESAGIPPTIRWYVDHKWLPPPS